MDCPQCGASVPSDDAFCGKCGYAMRNHGPERLDQSRIRVHEEPDSAGYDQSNRSLSHQRIRKHTMAGMPSAPTPLASARPARAGGRASQKTMLGIPRPEPLEPGAGPSAASAVDTAQGASSTGGEPAPGGGATQGPRQRVRVRYDSVQEPLSVTRRRQRTLQGLALLVVLAAAWLGYRFLTVNG
jgi:predicted nucleic acid-binding Zn ribbon protein